MKYISLDHEELGSEEYLQVVGSEERHWKSAEDFYLSTFDAYPFIDRGDFASFVKTTAKKSQYKSRLDDFLNANYEISLNGDEELFILCEDWNEQDYIFKTNHHYVRYYWETGA